MSKHLYFYSDALEWGGQEILAARIANILADKYQVHFFFSSEKFKTALNSSVEKISLPYHSQNPFPIVRDRISKKHKKTEQIFRDYGAGSDNFKKLIICPGNIERCIPAITAATKLKLQIISYYPMAFTQKESKATLGSLRDRLALRIYPKITKWIVNTPYQEQLLRRFIDIDTEVSSCQTHSHSKKTMCQKNHEKSSESLISEEFTLAKKAKKSFPKYQSDYHQTAPFSLKSLVTVPMRKRYAIK